MAARLTLSLAITAIGCTACTSERDAELARRMQGSWHVEHRIDAGTTYRMVGDNRADGAFVMRARVYKEGSAPADHQESGTWSIVDGLYRIRTLEVNGTRVPAFNAAYYETYEILSLDPGELVYRNTRDGVTYRARRVGSEHRLP
jgi:hypothetical protein